MAGLNLNMGAFGGASAGGYSGPIYGADGAASVPYTGGYADTAPGSGMTFGPGRTGSAATPTVHALAFGVFCFAALLFMGWALPR